MCLFVRPKSIPDRSNFVKASFGPPLLNFLGKRGITIQAGPNSSVRLAATYVDDRVSVVQRRVNGFSTAVEGSFNVYGCVCFSCSRAPHSNYCVFSCDF